MNQSDSNNSAPQADLLSGITITFQGGQAILPHSVMAEILPFAPTPSLENAPPWVAGTLLWKTTTIPLVSLEALLYGVDPERIQYHRILIVHGLGNHPRLHNFGFLSTSAPETSDFARADIEPDSNADAAGLPFGIAARIKVKGQSAIIPDMDILERDLLQLMRR